MRHRTGIFVSVCAAATLLFCMAAAAASALTWTQPYTGFDTNDMFMGVGFASTNVGWVVGSNGSNGFVMKTTDGGASWSTQDTGSYLTGHGAQSIVVLDSNTVMVAALNNGFIKTADGGTSWTSYDATFDSGWPRGMSFISSTTGWVSTIPADEGPKVYKTTSGGSSWTSVGPSESGAALPAVDFYDANNGIVVGDCWNGSSNYVWRTTDGGSAWNKIYLPTAQRDYMQGVANLDSTHAWTVGDNNAIFFSSDGGATWTRQSSVNTAYNLCAVDFVDSTHGWAVGTVQGGTSVIMGTSDGGSTWTRETTTCADTLVTIDAVASSRAFAASEFDDAIKGSLGDPPSIATLTSSTHSTQSTWYSNNDPALAWTASGATGYSHVLDQTTDTTPDETSEGTATSKTYTGIADGTWYFHVRAQNAAGWGDTSHYTVKIDVTAPTVVTDLASSTHVSQTTWYANNTPAFAWSASTDATSGLAGYSYVLDTSASTAPTAVAVAGLSKTYTAQADGTRYFHIRAVDNAGNRSATTVHYTVKIDTTKPVSTASGLQTSTTAGWRNSAQSVSLSASDTGGSGVASTDYTVDGSSWTDYSGAFAVSGQGNHTVTYRSTDIAGNVEVTKTGYVNIDVTNPGAIGSLASTSHPSQTTWYADDAPEFSWAAATDSGPSGIAGYSYVLDQTSDTTPGTTVTGTGLTASFNGKADGTWYFHVRAIDNAGNGGATSHYTVKIDADGPSAITGLASTTHPSQTTWYANTTPAFSWNAASDPNSGIAGYSYILDHTANTTPDTDVDGTDLTKVYSAQATGTWYFHVRAIDNVGNGGATSHYTVLIGSAPAPSNPSAPTTTVNAPSGWSKTAVTLTFSAAAGSNPVARVQYNMDGGAWNGQEGSSATLTVSTSGQHTVQYRSVDTAGTTEAAKSCTVNVDTNKPTTAAVKKMTVKKGKKVQLPVKVSDATSPTCVITVQILNKKKKVVKTIKLGQKNVSTAGTTYKASFKASMKKGKYYYRAQATDLAGNKVAKAPTKSLMIK